MIAFVFLLLFIFLLGEHTIFALMALSVAFWASQWWTGRIEAALDLIFFYGALTGCLIAWF
jgi:hypothetical protein